MIAAIVASLVLVVIVMILVCLCLKKKKKANDQGGRNSTYTVDLYCEYHDSFFVCFSRARASVSSLQIITEVIYLCSEYKKPVRGLRVCNSCLWLLELSIYFFFWFWINQVEGAILPATL